MAQVAQHLHAHAGTHMLRPGCTQDQGQLHLKVVKQSTFGWKFTDLYSQTYSKILSVFHMLKDSHNLGGYVAFELLKHQVPLYLASN